MTMRITHINPKGWYDIPGYEGVYQINFWAKIRKILYPGQYKVMKTFIKKDGRQYVNLYKNRKYKQWPVMRLMRITFIGKLSEGYVAYHKDGMKSNDELSNIGVITRSELSGKVNARSKSMKVVKINSDGEIVDYYKSIRSAARKNDLSYGTLVYYVSKKAQYIYAPDGYAYCKDHGGEIVTLLKKIEQDKNSGVRI